MHGTTASETLQDALDVVAAALALGADVPAAPGMSIWSAEVRFLDSSGGVRFGPYPTRKDCLAALASYARTTWSMQIDGPWLHPQHQAALGFTQDDPELLREQWLDSLSHEQLVEEYFHWTSDESYFMGEQVIVTFGRQEIAS